MANQFIRTSVQNIVKNMKQSVSALGRIRDFSFKNVGADNATLILNGTPVILNAGDPMLTVSGYENAYRNDNFSIKFATTVNPKIEFYYTQVEGDCDN